MHLLQTAVMRKDIGGLPKGADPLKAPSSHSPAFYIDESGIKTGIKAFLYLVTDYMQLSKEGNLNLSVKK